MGRVTITSDSFLTSHIALICPYHLNEGFSTSLSVIHEPEVSFEAICSGGCMFTVSLSRTQTHT